MRIVLTLAAGLLALVATTAAFGHSEPVRFNPAPGQVLDASPSTSGPSVSISAPDVIKGSDVTVSLKAEGVEIRLPTNEGQDPAFAHYHLYLDIPPNVTHSHNGSGEPTNPNDIMTT